MLLAEIALKSIELGAQDFIVKPFEISELRFRIQRVLEKVIKLDNA